MRTIQVPLEAVVRWLDKGVGRSCIIPVVNTAFPELRLTEDQILANVIARDNDEPPPFEDHQFISIEIVPD